MKGKITLLVGGAIGYVLGTRAGRERYEQIKTQAQNLWHNPKVQEKASQAQDLAKEKGPQVGQKVADAAAGAATAAKDKISGDDAETPSSPAGTGSVTGPGGSAGGQGAYPTSASTGL